MPTILFIYCSTNGQTLKICQRMAEIVKQTDQDVEIMSLSDAVNIHWPDYHQVIIGASIRYGHLNKALYQFIHRHQAQLSQRKNGFFCVNLTARKADKNTPETNAYMQKFLTLSPWSPQQQAVFAGALLYSQYGFFDKFMIRLIMKITGGVTDTSRDIEYTDWNKVDEFAKSILAQ